MHIIYNFFFLYPDFHTHFITTFNQRFFDLVRTNQFIEVMENHLRTEKVRNQSSGSKSDYYGNEKYNTYVPNPKLENWQLLLPIPYNVMISAPNATQNVGY